MARHRDYDHPGGGPGVDSGLSSRRHSTVTGRLLILSHRLNQLKQRRSLRTSQSVGGGGGPVPGWLSPPSLDRATAPDLAWHTRVYPSAAHARENSKPRRAAAALAANARERHLSLFPFFTEGFPLCEQGAFEIGSEPWQRQQAQMRENALAGNASHWIFNRGYYLEKAATWHVANDVDHAAHAYSIPFLQYLLDGHRLNFAPHPLFSHAAYLRLNALADVVHPFWHYALEGMFDDAQTSALFDPAFYVAENGIAALEIGDDRYVNSLQHFICKGIGQGLAFSPEFDADFYTARYPDVQPAINAGICPSAAHHFLYFGIRSGRQISARFDPNFYLERHPFVRREMEALALDTPLEHFLLLGRDRGLDPVPPRLRQPSDLDAAAAALARRATRERADVLHRGLAFDRIGGGAAATISLVLVAHRDPDLTAQALRCAYFAAAHCATGGQSAEVIVIADGAPAETRALFDRCPGLRVEWHHEPVGYSRAADAGVLIATGAVVVVATDAISFAPDTLLRLADRLAGAPDVGVAGVLSLSPDEMVRDAGCYVLNDGSVVAFGAGEPGSSNLFDRVVEVDFCPATMIAFRKTDYGRVGGFDRNFVPGSYEGADFGLRLMAELNLRSVCDPAVKVVGHERQPDGRFSRASERRNRERLLEKHSERIEALPDPETADAGRLSLTRNGLSRVLLVIRGPYDPARTTEPGIGLAAGRLLADNVAFDVLNTDRIGAVRFDDPAIRVFNSWLPGETLTAILSRPGASYTHVVIDALYFAQGFVAELIEAHEKLDLEVVEIVAPDSRAGAGIASSDRDRIRRIALSDLTALLAEGACRPAKA